MINRVLSLLAVAVLLLAGCTEMTVPEDITDRLDNLEERVAKLESLCNQINTNVSSLQSIVDAMQQGDYITDVTPLVEDGVEVGYVISFAQRGKITIYHGEDGEDGKDGKDGEDGQDGKDASAVVPQIGLRQDSDGAWYWTLDGEWLLDDAGNKVKAVGGDVTVTPGPPGDPGKDGITPQFKIEDDYWFISYDNGVTWEKLGKATGEDGKDGQDGKDGVGSSGGDSIFSSVTQDADYVYFTLADGTVLTVQKKAGSGLNIEFSVEQGVAIMPDVVSKFSYTVTGGDENTLVRASFGGGLLAEDGVVIVKPTSASSGEIHLLYYSFEEYLNGDKNDPYWEEEFGGEVNRGERYDSNLFILVSVTDGKGNSILKSLNFTEGILSSVSEAYETEASAGTVTVQVKTNLDYGYEVFIPRDASWLSYVPTKAEIRTDELEFKVAENTGSLSRSAVVELRNEKGMAMEEFTIVQKSPISDKAITFADAAVKAACVAKFDKNGDGVLTYGEVSTVTDVRGLFDDLAKSKITSFEEFENFVAVTTLPYEFLYGAEKLTSLKLPESLTNISHDALAGCKSLKTLVIPEGVTNCSFSLYNCIALKSVKLPSGATSLPSFEGCASLESINIPTGVTLIPYNAFEGCSSLTSFDLSNIKEIGTSAFAGSGLTSVTIPEAILEIPAEAFAGCENLKSVKLHDNIVKIGDSAFGSYYVYSENNYYYKYCSSLTDIDLPENLQVIGYSAFAGSALKGSAISGTDILALEIPANVINISRNAFNCPSLTAVKMNSSAVPEAGRDMFPAGTVVYVPEGSVESYKAANYWSDYVILSDKMMTLSLALEYNIASDVTYLSEDRSFNVPVTFKLLGKESDMSSVKEYGLLLQHGYDQIRIPASGLNKELTEELKIDRYIFDADTETYTAVADINISGYILLNDDSMLTFDKSPAQIKYDTKPSITYAGYEVVKTVSESWESRAEIDMKFNVKGSYWIDRFEMEYDGDGYWSSDRMRDLEDGLYECRCEWQLWDDVNPSSQMTIQCAYTVVDNWEEPYFLDPITLSYSEIFK